MARQNAPKKRSQKEAARPSRSSRTTESLQKSADYKRLRRMWWMILGLAMIFVLAALFLTLSRRIAGLFGTTGQYLGLIFELFAAVCLVSAWIFDYKKIRPFVKKTKREVRFQEKREHAAQARSRSQFTQRPTTLREPSVRPRPDRSVAPHPEPAHWKPESAPPVRAQQSEPTLIKQTAPAEEKTSAAPVKKAPAAKAAATIKVAPAKKAAPAKKPAAAEKAAAGKAAAAAEKPAAAKKPATSAKAATSAAKKPAVKKAASTTTTKAKATATTAKAATTTSKAATAKKPATKAAPVKKAAATKKADASK